MTKMLMERRIVYPLECELKTNQCRRLITCSSKRSLLFEMSHLYIDHFNFQVNDETKKEQHRSLKMLMRE